MDNEHMKSMGIKYAIILVALAIALALLANLTFWSIVLISVVATALAYVIDLVVLPQSNNTVATITNLVMAFLVVYAFSFYYTAAQISWFDALIAAVVVAAAEWICNKYFSTTAVEQK